MAIRKNTYQKPSFDEVLVSGKNAILFDSPDSTNEDQGDDVVVPGVEPVL